MKKICKTLMLLMFIIIATSILVSASEIPSVLKTDVTLCASEDDGITGTGTKSDPYIIDSASDFIAFTGGMNSGNTYQGKYFEQVSDIDLADNSEYTGCDDEKYFQGYYDGKGHTININLSGDNKFVFSYVQGKIMNLGFTGSITNTMSSDVKPYGTPIRYLLETGKLVNCYSTLTVASNFYGSGLVGNIKGGTAVNCYFAGVICENVPHKGAITWHLTNEGVISNSYYITEVLYPHGATQINAETIKTSLADTLNEGRNYAAEVSGISIDNLCSWVNKNGYPIFYTEEITIENTFEIGSGDFKKYTVKISNKSGVCNCIAAAYDIRGRMVGADIINNSCDSDGIVTVNVAKSLESNYVKVMSFDVSGNLKVLDEATVSYGNLITNGDAENDNNSAFYSENGKVSIVTDEDRGNVWEVVPNSNTLYTYLQQKFTYIPGATYKVNAYIKFLGVSVSNDTSTIIQTNTRYLDNFGKTDHIQSRNTIKTGVWVPVEYTFTVPENVLLSENEQFAFYANPVNIEGKDYGATFRVDDINVQLLEKTKKDADDMFTVNPFEGKEEINVVFLGGSITEGYNSSIYAKSYVGRCTKWLKDTFAGQTVNCYNAGIGGTGSNFGMVRMDRDVMSKDPDMIFVEFAVNDGNKDSCATMDSIMRKILSAEKTPYVVFLYTTDNEYKTDSSYHHMVASYYGIPEIDLKAALIEKTEGEDPFELGLFSDAVHPLDGGFEIYASAIIERLSEESCYVKPQNKEPMSNDSLLFNTDFIPSPNYSHSDGWTEKTGHRGYKALYTTTPGETVTFEFYGNFLAIEGGLHRESALVDVYVDDKLLKTVSFYYDMDAFQSSYAEITHMLPMGHHNVKIEVREETNPSHPGSTVMLYHIITGTTE